MLSSLVPLYRKNIPCSRSENSKHENLICNEHEMAWKWHSWGIELPIRLVSFFFCIYILDYAVCYARLKSISDWNKTVIVNFLAKMEVKTSWAKLIDFNLLLLIISSFWRLILRGEQLWWCSYGYTVILFSRNVSNEGAHLELIGGTQLQFSTGITAYFWSSRNRVSWLEYHISYEKSTYRCEFIVNRDIWASR